MKTYTLLLAPGTALDVPVEVSARGQHQLTLTDEAAAQLSARPGVTLREAWRASAKAVTTEGYATLFDAGDWQEAGWTGKGVTVAVLDVGFLGAEDLYGSELPEDTERLTGGLDATPHGTAVAEVIHDLAPEARILLVRFSTDTEFLSAIDLLIAEEVDIVNASIGFDNVWPADGSSPVSAAVTELVEDHGVLWVAAAGNEARRYQIGPLSREADSDRVLLDGEARWALEGSSPSARLRWDEPMDGAQTDLQLRLVTEDGTVCGSGTARQDGDDPPLESAAPACDAAPLFAEIYVDADVSVDGLTGYLYAPGSFTDTTPRAQTLTLPADAAGAITVSACSVSDGAPGYASRGPTEDGRLKPDLCGPHGVRTVSESPFDGTSSSAPHVAGLLALMVEAEGLVSGDEARAALVSRALPLGDTGEAIVFGAGMAQAGAPPERRCGCVAAAGGGAGLWWLGVLGLAMRRRTG